VSPHYIHPESCADSFAAPAPTHGGGSGPFLDRGAESQAARPLGAPMAPLHSRPDPSIEDRLYDLQASVLSGGAS